MENLQAADSGAALFSGPDDGDGPQLGGAELPRVIPRRLDAGSSPLARAVAPRTGAGTGGDSNRAGTPGRTIQQLNGRQKAAVIVRLLLAEGAQLPLASLPDHLQAALTEQIGRMRLVDRETLARIVEEFLEELECAGLAFPGGIEGALGMLDGHISSNAANRLRRLAGASVKADPWERIAAHDIERLLPLIERESVEVGAVMLAKISVEKAAALLERLPGAQARRVAYAVSLTAEVDPEAVRRIGLSLLAQIEAQPPRAFETDAVSRMGAILNSSPQETRDSVLTGLEETDTDFAREVRRAIFTFDLIPVRIRTHDLALIARSIEQPVLVTALAAARDSGGDSAAAAEFVLDGLTQRLAASLRDLIEERGTVRPRDGEAAMREIVRTIRRMINDGTLSFIDPDED